MAVGSLPSCSHSTSQREIKSDDLSLNNPLLLHGDQEFKSKIQQGDTTFLRTCINGLNALSGVGILSIPYALSEGGWLSLVLLFITAIICCYTGLLLQRCLNEYPVARTYPDIGEIAFGYKGRVVIATFMYLELYLVAIEFLILEGDNLDKLFPNVSYQIMGLRLGGRQVFILVSAILILPTTWLKSLSLLAYVSTGGVLASLILVVSVLWAGAVDGVGFHGRGTLFNWSGVPTSFSLFAFCYCGHPVFPTLHSSMKDKSQFSKVLILCFILCTLNYGSIAVLGYLMYGEDVDSQITLNLPLGKLSSNIAIYTTLINPLTKYALMITPIATAVEGIFPLKSKKLIWPLNRTLLVISTVVIALTVPLFGDLITLTGAVLSSTASMVLPCICYLKISKASQTYRFETVIITGILVIGLFVAVVGTYTSIQQILQHL